RGQRQAGPVAERLEGATTAVPAPGRDRRRRARRTGSKARSGRLPPSRSELSRSPAGSEAIRKVFRGKTRRRTGQRTKDNGQRQPQTELSIATIPSGLLPSALCPLFVFGFPVLV